MKKTVHFKQGGGRLWETVKEVVVEAETEEEAIEKAIEIYDKNGWDFDVNDIEVK